MIEYNHLHQEDMTNLLAEANRIMDLLEKEFVFPDGSLFLEKSKTGGIFYHHIFPDLGDFIPYFLYFGRKPFVYGQIDHYKKNLKDGYLISEHRTFGINGLVKSYEYTDLLLGLVDLYEMDPTESNKKMLTDTADLAIRTFCLNSKPNSFYYKRFHLPIFDTRDSTFIEIFCDMETMLEDPRYGLLAKNIYKHLVELPFFRKYGLLPTFATYNYGYSIFSKTKLEEKFNRAIFQKNNTNSLFAFHALAKSGFPDAYITIDRILDVIKDIMAESDGRIPFEFRPGSTYQESSLPSCFPLIDCLCDLYVSLKRERYLDMAKEIADYWLERQGKTGLFPKNSSENTSWFDSETDLTVALYKLWEVSGKEKYKRAADSCFDAIIKYHGALDYPLILDINTGAVINDTQRTKFLALFLKLLILRIEYERGNTIYGDKALFNLLRDR